MKKEQVVHLDVGEKWKAACVALLSRPRRIADQYRTKNREEVTCAKCLRFMEQWELYASHKEAARELVGKPCPKCGKPVEIIAFDDYDFDSVCYQWKCGKPASLK